MKILIVDDDINQLDALKNLLNLQLKASIETVSQIRNVRSTTDFFQPEIILLDLGLGGEPENSGLPVLRNLKRGYYSKNIPIIIITGNNDTNTLKSALRWGVDDYVIKPYDTNDLIERINKVLAKKAKNA